MARARIRRLAVAAVASAALGVGIVGPAHADPNRVDCGPTGVGNGVTVFYSGGGSACYAGTPGTAWIYAYPTYKTYYNWNHGQVDTDGSWSGDIPAGSTYYYGYSTADTYAITIGG